MDEATAKGRINAFIEKAKRDKFEGFDAFDLKRSQRRAIRTQLTKHSNHLQNALSDANPCPDRIEIGTEKVTKAFEDLTELDEYILSFISQYDDDDAVVEADTFLADSWYVNTERVLAAARKAIRDLTPPAPLAAPTAAPAAHLSELRLPKVELPTFEGSSSSGYHSWVTQFDNLIHNKSMPNHQKLLYLKTCCTHEAKKIADGYSVTDDNYDKLYGVFKKRFGKPRMIKQSYAEKIIKMKKFSTHELRATLNTLESSIKCLEEFHTDTEAISVIVVPMVEMNMSDDIKTKWLEHISEDDDHSTTKLLEFLQDRVDCLPISATKPSDGKNHNKEGHKQNDAPKTTSSMTTRTESARHCWFCNKNNHDTEVCSFLGKKQKKERFEFLMKNRLCFKCARKGHQGEKCEESVTCRKCQSTDHPTVLHHEEKPKPISKQTETPRGEDGPKTTANNASTKGFNGSSILKSFKATAVGDTAKRPIRAMLDDGSQNTWITQQVVDELNLPIVGKKTFSVAVAFSATLEPPKEFSVAKVTLKTTRGNNFTMDALVRDGPLCIEMDAVPFDPTKEFSHLKNIRFADCFPREEEQVEILIGADYAEAIKTGARAKGKITAPVGVQTIFGWILCGACPNFEGKRTSCQKVTTRPFKGIESELKQFYEAECLGTQTHKEPMVHEVEENDFRKEVQQNIIYDDVKKQYQATIPYKENVKQLGDNEKIAKILHQKQMQKLDKNPTLKEQVKAVFDDQERQGIIEEVTSEKDDPNTQKHFLPWHSVIREGHSTTPIRNVMNASKEDKNGLSLNKCQYAGPNLLPEVIGLLLQFRNNPIAVIADISKMFFRITIPDQQKDLHRFFAFEKLMRQCTLLFGEASSPYLSGETILEHANRMERMEKFLLAVKAVRDQLYIDDTITGTWEIQVAIQLLEELIQFFDGMCMKVQKINSNCQAVLDAMDPSLLENKVHTSVLGIEWNTSEDTLAPKTVTDRQCQTKRDVLAMLASIYDPLGLKAPLTCRGKILMQSLWQLQLGWDDKIPNDVMKHVDLWQEASKISPTVQRFWGKIKTVDIFCDASEESFAAAAYGTSPDKNGASVNVHLMMAKTRVKSIKETTIPRLELQGAVLAANMHTYITKYLGPLPTTFWTDSTIVLNWIHTEASQYKVFVGNRVKLIQDNTKQNHTTCDDHWKWVPGTQNPADIPSRGIWPLSEKQNELWLHGPEFLKSGEYPDQPIHKKEQCELKKTAVNIIPTVTDDVKPIVKMERFSNINRLLNTMVYVFRFINRKTGASEGPPTADEREVALQNLIKMDQKQHFNKDIHNLQQGALHKDSKLKGLNPILMDGILMMRGRVQTEPELIILHHESHLAKLLITHTHHENLHSGASHTLNELRQKYWIIKGFATVKSQLRTCVTCKKANTRLAGQQMAPLPEWRTTPSPPFTHTGMDYAGPLYVTKTGAQKRYILLFTCGVTRAVHLELTQSLDTKDFLLAFECFRARRGTPSVLYSDNGTSFVAASKAIPHIKWEFITPLAPWHGAIWERLVRSIKAPLRKVVGGARLKEVELRVVLTKIEGVINSRPLTVLKGDETRQITPAELINGRPLGKIDIPYVQLDATRRLQHLERTKEQFWKQWQKCYLPSLHSRIKWQTCCPNVKEGDIVLLLKENTKRHTWPLAKVLETVVGRDNLVRTVKVICDGKEIVRPIQHIVPLEVPSDKNEHIGSRD